MAGSHETFILDFSDAGTEDGETFTEIVGIPKFF
jgi:hypothetical protein